MARRILALQERLRGAEHADTLLTCQGLAVCLQSLQQPQEALTYARRALAGYQKEKAPGAENRNTQDAQRLVDRLTKEAAKEL